MLAKGYSGIENEAKRILPLVGQLGDGYYVVAEFEQFPCVKHSGQDSTFTDFLLGSSDPCSDPYDGAVNFRDKYSTYFGYECGGFHSVPLFLWGTLKPESLDWSRVEFYMAAMRECENTLPHPIALYLSGAVSLVVDGYHRIATAAMLGKCVNCTLILPIGTNKNLEGVFDNGEPLFLSSIGESLLLEPQKTTYDSGVRTINGNCSGPLRIVDKKGKRLSVVRSLPNSLCLGEFDGTFTQSHKTWEKASCGPITLDTQNKTNAVTEGEPDAPECKFLERYRPVPFHLDADLLESATRIDSSRIKETIQSLRILRERILKGACAMGTDIAGHLLSFHKVFPKSKWITDSDCEFLRNFLTSALEGKHGHYFLQGANEATHQKFHAFQTFKIGDFRMPPIWGADSTLFGDCKAYMEGRCSIEEFKDLYLSDFLRFLNNGGMRSCMKDGIVDVFLARTKRLCEDHTEKKLTHSDFDRELVENVVDYAEELHNYSL